MTDLIIHRVYSGREFNKLTTGQIFFKILNNNWTHYQFKYQVGLNIDNIAFDPVGDCRAGGLYFTSFENIGLFSSYDTLVSRVTIPSDAKVYVEDRKYKADKFELDNPIKINNFYIEYYSVKNSLKLRALRKDGLLIEYIKNQTQELCDAAVEENPYSIRYVQEKFRTQELKDKALRRDYRVSKYL